MPGTRRRYPRNMTSCLFILTCLHILALDFVKGNELFFMRVVAPAKPHEVKQDFLSVAISHHVLAVSIHRWSAIGFDFESKKLFNLMEALSPAYIRIGGIRAELTTFNADNPEFLLDETVEEWKIRFQRGDYWTEGVMGNWYNEKITNQTWNSFMRMMHNINWKVQYGLNYALMKNGSYDTSYAIKFLQYNKDELGLQVDTVELVNEPNSLGHKWNARIDITWEGLARETQNLKDAMVNAGFGDVKISGPDVTSLARSFVAVQYLNGFLTSGGNNSVDYIALHHYNVNGKTVGQRDLMNRHILDKVRTLLTRAEQVTSSVGARQPIILSETACCYNGGSPSYGNTFVGGFMWLDELGLAAKFGIVRVNRQTLLYGDYRLLDPLDTSGGPSYTPTPDYYTAVLFKRLVEGPVLEVQHLPLNPDFRMYANCARRDYYNFPVGSIVLYYLNLEDFDITLESELFDYKLKLFILTPGENGALNSTHLALNGKILDMPGDELPEMAGKDHEGSVDIPDHSYGFIVVTSANQKNLTCWELVSSMAEGEDLYEVGLRAVSGTESSLREKITVALLAFCLWLALFAKQ